MALFSPSAASAIYINWSQDREIDASHWSQQAERSTLLIGQKAERSTLLIGHS
jgi:hypothetical protein